MKGLDELARLIQTSGFRTLNEGERVEFEVVQADKGPAADRVTRPDGPEGGSEPGGGYGGGGGGRGGGSGAGGGGRGGGRDDDW